MMTEILVVLAVLLICRAVAFIVSDIFWGLDLRTKEEREYMRQGWR